jgi:photosystem II stability/assembly factor-like uncharacterized protein
MTEKTVKRWRIIIGVFFFIIINGPLMAPSSQANDSKNHLLVKDIHENIYGSAIISESEYLLAGSRGKIFRSEDNGKTWQEIPSGTRKTLYSVSFPDSKTGWIAGQSGMILHTIDGGRSWSEQNSGTEKHLFAISFSDTQHGCAVGDWGIIVVTDDGGLSWKDASIEEDVILYDIYTADSQNGCAVGEFGRIFQTSDGCQNWMEIESPNPAGLSLFCMSHDNDSLYAGGLDGLILYSNDVGKTWQRASNGVNKSIYGISVQGETGWAVGDSGTVLHTEDSGKSWQQIDVPEAYKLFWLKAVRGPIDNRKDRQGFAAGANGLFITIQNQGLTW